jgi:hypothetical protein
VLLAIGGWRGWLLVSGQSTDPILRLADSCAEDDPQPFAGAAPGTELVELSAAQRSRFDAEASRALTAQEASDDVDRAVDHYYVRFIVANGRRLGTVVAYPGIGEEPELLRGFQAGVVQSDTNALTGRQIFVAGQSAQLHEGAGYGIVTGKNGCWGFAIHGPNGKFVSAVSRSLLVG